MSTSVISDSMVMSAGPDGPAVNGPIWWKMDMWPLCRGRKRRNFTLSEADKPGRSDGPTFQLLQQVSGLKPTTRSYCAFNSGHDTCSKEEFGEPEISKVNAM
ncbi:hypothetical protein BUALT_Bualt07G0165900 [Buddleja alternifolia]|uniref:Uncharacterized protein n=1 Tax=Buddleja alternifolia TaxID=168488 RepID=A0AAV6XHU2_9LAMI|nr:hypothetical protein BUALT_Bualt07G0165900 [Buddleja alternifolia]